MEENWLLVVLILETASAEEFIHLALIEGSGHWNLPAIRLDKGLVRLMDMGVKSRMVAENVGW